MRLRIITGFSGSLAGLLYSATPSFAQAWYVGSFNDSTTTPTDSGNKVYKYTAAGVATGSPLDLPDADTTGNVAPSSANRGSENVVRMGNSIVVADYWRRELNLYSAINSSATAPTSTISLNTTATGSNFWGINVLPYSSGGTDYLFVTGRNTGTGSAVRVARYNFSTGTFDRTLSLANDAWGISRQTFGGVDRLLITEGFQGTTVSNVRAYDFNLAADTTAFTSGVLNLNGAGIATANRITAPGEIVTRADGSFYTVRSVVGGAARVTYFTAAGAAQSTADITGFNGFDLALGPDGAGTALYATAASASGAGKIVKLSLNTNGTFTGAQSDFITSAAGGASGSYGVKSVFYDAAGFVAIPEPGALALLGLAGLGLPALRRRGRTTNLGSLQMHSVKPE